MNRCIECGMPTEAGELFCSENCEDNWLADDHMPPSKPFPAIEIVYDDLPF